MDSARSSRYSRRRSSFVTRPYPHPRPLVPPGADPDTHRVTPPTSAPTRRAAWRPGEPLAPLGSTLLGLLLSFVASREGVADAVFHFDPDARIHPGAATAWGLFAAVAVYTALDYRVRHAEAARREDERDAAIGTLVERTRQIANRSTVEVVEGYYDFTRRVNEEQRSLQRAAPGAMAPEVVDEHIRSALQAALSLLQLFDTAARERRSAAEAAPVEYTANLMLFRQGTGLNDDVCRDLEHRMLFQTGEIDIRRLPGFLELRREWSVTNAAGGQGIDTKIDALVLQIPHNFSAGDQHLALPGAPTAWCKGTIDVVHDVDELPARVTREQTAVRQAADKIRPYFATQARHIRSFISVPLEALDGRPERIGVLNLNCSLKGMLGGQGEVERIGPLLKTLCVPLSGAVQAALGLVAPPDGGRQDGAGRLVTAAGGPDLPPTGTGVTRVTAEASVRKSGARPPRGQRRPPDDEPPKRSRRPKPT